MSSIYVADMMCTKEYTWKNLWNVYEDGTVDTTG